MPVTRSELVQRLAALADITDRDAEVAVNAVLETISGALEQGGRIELRGFDTQDGSTLLDVAANLGQNDIT